MLRDPKGVERKFLHDTFGPSAGNVLEIGCGDGRLTVELLKVTDSILALDPDPDSIEKARFLLGKGVSLILGSGESLPLADKSVDTVIFSLSLHHHPEPGNALDQAQQVLKDQGRILVLEPDSDSSFNSFFNLIANEEEAYRKAEESINKCIAHVIDQGTFTTTTEYDDFDEMIQHLYSYVDHEPESSQVEVMKSTLGSAAKDRPLQLEESTRWWLLTKSSSC